MNKSHRSQPAAAEPSVREFHSLLVANRGEIARRIIASAKARGLRTVAVYSDADRDALHVREADVAVRLGGAPASESYLSIAAILAAARSAGAEAIHPGYGFLSERAEFAQAVAEAGLVFVGPSAAVMEQMGRKDRARRLAQQAGVPVVPQHRAGAEVAVDGATAPDLTAAQFPVLVKAAAGGGGKGMRIVRAAEDLQPAIEAAAREAKASFGDDTLLIERYVENGRHVEVQIFADSHGHTVHLGERDCSAQRRHQKVIEEAPAPQLSSQVRSTLLTSAVALAHSVGYVGAGTVEFLVDGERAYFLEMNTRLQVEHPVTEMTTRVCGNEVDLVDLQLRIAAGEPLGFEQHDVSVIGHAFEARLYAEDAFGGFLPQAGQATFVRLSAKARIDAAVEAGTRVGTFYDPMLGKIITRGPDRDAALTELVAALDDSAVLGLTTNLGFLRALAASEAFTRGEVHTSWLDDNPEVLQPPAEELAVAVAAWITGVAVREDPQAYPGQAAFAVRDSWRGPGPAAVLQLTLRSAQSAYRCVVGAEAVTVCSAATLDKPGAQLTHTYQLATVRRSAEVWALEVDDVNCNVVAAFEPHVAGRAGTPSAIEIALRGQRSRFELGASTPDASSAADSGEIVAPMPGTMLSVEVRTGEEVAAGQRLGLMEAMKMELTMTAPAAGTVEFVGVAAGVQVSRGQRLFALAVHDGTGAS